MGKKIEGLEVYDDAELYDLLAASNNAIVEFYDEEARKLGGPVLELACGTGRLTIPLAQSGLEVVGIDLHPGMLARARAAAEAAHVQVEFVETDMRDFSLQKRFGLIFVAYNSLLHLLQSEDLAACFTNVATSFDTERKLHIGDCKPQSALARLALGRTAQDWRRLSPRPG